MLGRRIIVMRHGERCDFAFNTAGESWMKKAFDSNGRYNPTDLNMPNSVPSRRDGWEQFRLDPPLTQIGNMQAELTGQALREAQVQVDDIYCSPALRCVQTAHGVIKGLGTSTAINVEPGVYEWMQWLKSVTPSWMAIDDLKSHGYPVNAEYSPIIEAASLPLREPLEDYYERAYTVTKEFLRKRESGTILIVAHGDSLDTCTRQLCGGSPRSFEELWPLVQRTPFLASVQIIEAGSTWKLAGSPVAPLTHCANVRYDANQYEVGLSSI